MDLIIAHAPNAAPDGETSSKVTRRTHDLLLLDPNLVVTGRPRWSDGLADRGSRHSPTMSSLTLQRATPQRSTLLAPTLVPSRPLPTSGLLRYRSRPKGRKASSGGSRKERLEVTSMPEGRRRSLTYSCSRGRPSSPNPVTSSPSQLLPSMGQTTSTGPTSLSLPQVPSTAGPRLTNPPLPQLQPSAHSPSEPNSSHVAISLLSHVALVSPDPTSPLPIPVGLVNEAMDVAHIDPPGPMATSPLPHPIHEVPPPRPPDPCPIR
ncbi:hypothetical protein K2173_014327 [Erythroxylum novogranatense]|uniref:Uncharacterized protein n=1 Tax=Erythroxylum novogranatense TaxID=1862640 RepID=A0AAV8S5F8_9ROSI|nr:hypothetical protein K2173_014327 [Erythroxylum novogranatense]